MSNIIEKKSYAADLYCLSLPYDCIHRPLNTRVLVSAAANKTCSAGSCIMTPITKGIAAPIALIGSHFVAANFALSNFFQARFAFLFDSPLVLAIISLHKQYLRYTDHWTMQPSIHPAIIKNSGSKDSRKK